MNISSVSSGTFEITSGTVHAFSSLHHQGCSFSESSLAASYLLLKLKFFVTLFY